MHAASVRTSSRSSARNLLAWAVAASALLSGLASAMPTTYTGSGLVGPTAPPIGPTAPFLATGIYDFSGMGSFSLLSNFDFNFVTGTGSGTFSFTQGGQSFSGSLTTTSAPVALGPGFEIAYTVTAGTGIYSGFTGGGNGLIRLLSDPAGPPPYSFIEAGIMNVVPEPATYLMMLGGIAGLVALRLRRRD
jgi:hypothetical protein